MDKQIDKTVERITNISRAVAEVIGLVLLICGIFTEGMEGRILWFLFFILTAAFVSLIVFLCRCRKEIAEREEFLEFLHFLFNCRGGNKEGFRVLPRMCLDFERKGIVNPIHIKSLQLKFTSDITEHDEKKSKHSKR